MGGSIKFRIMPSAYPSRWRPPYWMLLTLLMFSLNFMLHLILKIRTSNYMLAYKDMQYGAGYSDGALQ